MDQRVCLAVVAAAPPQSMQHSTVAVKQMGSGPPTFMQNHLPPPSRLAVLWLREQALLARLEG